ncbi:MAG: alpha/beta hydrolase [Armatimonadetes bacterium]|nr:alpha/beta hydrolase [Armatimonadota bacterium]
MKAILIHGAGGGGWEYHSWKPVLERRGMGVIAKDLLPAPDGLAKTTLADYVAQAKSWLPNKEPVVLVGASMGGIIALKVAETVRASAIVLVNSVPPAGVKSARTPTETFPAVVKWANGPIAETRAAMPDADEKAIQKAWRGWRDESGAVMNELYARVAVRKPTCPVLVVIGGKDTDISPETSRNVAAWATADVFEYAGMSHVGPLLGKRGAEVAATVATWVETKTAR